jgi:hypothetical protein
LHFWKYVSSIRQNDKNPIEHEIDGNRLIQQREAAEAFAVLFRVSSTGAT